MSGPVHRHEPGPAVTGNGPQDSHDDGHGMRLILVCCIPMALAIALIVLGR